ncbi:carboxylesterase/lipase family protein [Staphylococcus sp. 11007852]|uniref:carboxylesterase family protein n=1 Tax=Staphylococcus TaxID=1279 RepID=UPI00140414EA|nr:MULTISPECIES: carboxylesterase family protein [Staphylococcus]NHM74547.1 carboxylesterase/lipase family protein [Staphylococcus sp. 11007852]NJH83032.1 carboxylesterase family protein [Staphylococcus agnetis]
MIRVETGLGDILGESHPRYDVFKGIPYAIPPVGDLRFQAARPYSKRLDEFKATQFGAVPIQPPNSLESFFNVTPTHYTQSEDCLTLNIWRPHGTTDSDRLPVIVYVYGGSFVNGHSALDMYNPEHFVAQHRVIVVTFNYRLGALGFLNWSEINPAWDYNLGLSDQQCAFQWVHDHISFFGGNPHCVTAMGQSAGAMSIQALLCHPKTHNLIHRAVLLSGALQWMTYDTSTLKAQEFETLKQTHFPSIPWTALSPNHILTLMAHQQVMYGKSKGLEFLYAPIKTSQFTNRFAHLRLPVLIVQTEAEGDIYIKSEKHTLDPQQFQKVAERNGLDVPHRSQIQTASQQRDWITTHYFHRPIATLSKALSTYTDTWCATFAWSRPDHRDYASSYHILDVPFWFGQLEILAAHGLRLRAHDYNVSQDMMQDLNTFAQTGYLPWDAHKIYQ